MNQTSKEIEDWIKPYASIVGESIDIDKKLKKLNTSKYFLQLTIPNKFEKYGIALHSYWINHNLSKEEFTRVKWKDVRSGGN